VVAVGTWYAKYIKKISLRAQKAIAQTDAVAMEVISNMRTVRSFTNEGLERKRFVEKSNENLSLSQKVGRQLGILQGLTSIALNGIGLVVYWYGGYQVSLGHISTGALTAFMMHTLSLQNSAQHLSILLGQVLAANGAIARLEEVAKISPKIGGSVNSHLLKLPNVKGAVELRNVTFSYPSREHQKVLSNFTLSLPAGKVTALVGPSGGGKTTVTSLIERFYDPQSGEVTLDDVPISVLDPNWLRSLVGIVSQEPVLFATTIKENIAYGRPGASDEDIIAAAQRAYVHDFVTAFPEGYNTMVGERGIQLSGGQKQRIAIARAILKNPRILILDEATSALDAESEAQVQEALHELMKGRTVLVIAHRLSTVQVADNIAVVCDGQIVETGNHQELMRKAGVYAQLVSRQLS
jgi:ABC-type multidrug transport system fused ATPase/permease subunit